MNLGVSIANLLGRYPAVGVSGIGVFRKTRRPASYDTDQAVFLPPVDHIELVDDADDVFQLTSYLEVQEHLDSAAAEARLEQAVSAVMNTISRNGEAVLDGLGYLLADGASFIFKPFDTDGFTAKPMAAPPATGAAVPVGTDIPAVGDTAAPADVVTEEPSAPEVASENTGKQINYMPWVIGGAVAAVLMATVWVWKYQPAWFGGNVIEQTAVSADDSVRPEPSSALTPQVATLADSLAADTNHAVVPAAPTDSATVVALPPAKPSVTYEIIVGSFATMRQANKFVAEMKAKGYDLQAIDSKMPGNRKKISWGSYATEAEAYAELARVQKTFEPGAWIAKISTD